MEIIFQRPGTCQRREGRDVPAAGKVETCQRREGRDVPAAGTSGREGRDVPAAGSRDVPAAGRSRRASGGHQRRRASGRNQRRGRASGRKVETCQRREGRDVPAAGKVETCQRRAPAAGRSRRASGREGRDVPAAGTSARRPHNRHYRYSQNNRRYSAGVVSNCTGYTGLSFKRGYAAQSAEIPL